MSKPDWKRKKKKPAKSKAPPSRFAPAAFLSGSPETVQGLCDELAKLASTRFQDLTGTTWKEVGVGIIDQLRATGHDLMNFDEANGVQDWQATWHHPRGTFSLYLAFRAPSQVEVTWKSEDATFTARAEASSAH